MIVAGLLAIGALVCTVVYLASPREPSYEGKTLSEWIAPFCRQTATGLDEPAGPQHFQELEPVRNAVRQIGTNAVPFLIGQLNHRESALHREVRQVLEKQSYFALRLTDPNVSKIRAIRALAILRTDARPAMQSLTAQLTNAAVSLHAVYALSGIGAEGMQVLVGQYTNVPRPVRIQIAVSIVSPESIYRGENATNQQMNQIPRDVWIEGNCLIAQDGTSPFRTLAIERLGMFGSLASNAVPVLMRILNEEQNSSTIQPAILAPRTFHPILAPRMLHPTIRALGEIRCQPEVVVPALINLLSDPNASTRLDAATALRAFGYDAQRQPSRFE
jgi:hypothetical protein